MTSDEIVGHIRDHWVTNLGVDYLDAEMRAERGFWHMLQTGAIREWGFDNTGNTLYEPHDRVVAQTILYVMVQKED